MKIGISIKRKPRFIMKIISRLCQMAIAKPMAE
jgi:hypothetical protein